MIRSENLKFNDNSDFHSAEIEIKIEINDVINKLNDIKVIEMNYDEVKFTENNVNFLTENKLHLVIQRKFSLNIIQKQEYLKLKLNNITSQQSEQYKDIKLLQQYNCISYKSSCLFSSSIHFKKLNKQ